MNDYQSQLDHVIRLFETISADSVSRLGEVYAQDAWFKDPFNEVRGLPAIERIFVHMFIQVDAPRFEVTTRALQGDDAFLTWDFRFCMKGRPGVQQCIRGVSHLRFGDGGLVCSHRDYWDAAEELYEKIPVLGALMRFLKRRAQA